MDTNYYTSYLEHERRAERLVEEAHNRTLARAAAQAQRDEVGQKQGRLITIAMLIQAVLFLNQQ